MSQSVNITCPKCHLDGRINVPTNIFGKTTKGLVTINVPRDFLCDHTFQIFIDVNGRVRGYQDVDFVIELTHQIKETISEALEDQRQQISVQGLISLLGSDIFLRIVKNLLIKTPITLISHNEGLNKVLTAFFTQKLPHITNTIFKQDIDYAQDQTWAFGLVIDLNYKMVVQDPEKLRFLIGEEFVREIWKISDHISQSIYFNNFIDGIYGDFEQLQLLLKGCKKTIRMKDLPKELGGKNSKKYDKHYLQLLYEILKSRNPDLEKMVDTFEKRAKEIDLL